MIEQILNKKIKINTLLLDPFHRSTIYKYKEYQSRTFHSKEKLTSLEFLWFIEQDVDQETISEAFTDEQNASIRVRIMYQCMRYNVIDSIYKYLTGCKKIKKKKKYYDFINEDNLIKFKTKNIEYEKLLNYDYFRFCLDQGYVLLNECFRTFYMNYFINAINKRLLKRAKERNMQITENLLIQKNYFIQYTFQKYQELLPEYPLKDVQKANFIQFFNSIVKNDPIWDNLCQTYNKVNSSFFYQKIKDAYINLTLQTAHYKEQIAIYLSFILKLIEMHPQIPIKDMCLKAVNYDVYFDINEQDSFYVTIKQNPYSPIEISLQHDNICLKDINRYIALLVQMEKHFYELLESIFIIILYHENNPPSKES
uniref:ORF-366 n=1 Tax=Physarum polycephalum TaxID=5791 RepID=Q35597_PHYPO|nr:ORF-366 [Physarum polycephalum]